MRKSGSFVSNGFQFLFSLLKRLNSTVEWHQNLSQERVPFSFNVRGH